MYAGSRAQWTPTSQETGTPPCVPPGGRRRGARRTAGARTVSRVVTARSALAPFRPATWCRRQFRPVGPEACRSPVPEQWLSMCGPQTSRVSHPFPGPHPDLLNPRRWGLCPAQVTVTPGDPDTRPHLRFTVSIVDRPGVGWSGVIPSREKEGPSLRPQAALSGLMVAIGVHCHSHRASALKPTQEGKGRPRPAAGQFKAQVRFPPFKSSLLY